tara:strand:+ start:7460 stop:7840 length:381 start_codon:yes stop_codon:yes gene_type:complete
MPRQELSLFREKVLPPLSSRVAGALYFIENGRFAELYFSDNQRTARLVGNSEMTNLLINSAIAVGGSPNEVEDYRSEFNTDGYIYAGYNLNNLPVINRYKDGVEEFAQALTDLETDWINRLTLTYI